MSSSSLINIINNPYNITIHLFPSYSPELTPVETVWSFLRSNYVSNYVSNQVYDALDDILNACCTARELLVTQPQVIFSIGMRSWI